VAKIVVADDNSNIQKMVGLALKDHGIEVVAVGNGEAAVRKISDIRPDLVLADVFMPVRNGYEVCKYVKDDSALSHIPVILLVGAFDPLDEQEAQRVGADGVLKKPFVPPDPLISMVKAALVRAGVAHAGFTPASAQVAAPESTPAEPPLKVPAVMTLPKPPLPEAETESFVEEVPAHASALKIDPGSQPLAFGSLLETPGTTTEEESATVTTAHPEIAQQRDWRALETDQEEEEPATDNSSWRRDAGDEDAAGEAARPARGWRDTAAFEEPGARSRPEEAWTPTKEKQDLTEAAGVQESVSAIATATRDASPMAPFAGDAWAAAIAAGSNNKTAVAEAEKPIEEPREQESPLFHGAAPAVTEERAVREPERIPDYSPVVAATEAPAAEAEKLSTASSWFSTPPSPWDAEAKKATQLASTWDAPVAAAVSEANAHEEVAATNSYEPLAAPDEIEVVSEAAAITTIPAEAVETVREEASHAVEQAAKEADKTDVPAGAKEATQDALAQLDMDDVVAKVLARMNPGMMQAVTREILRPVVEAILREELHSKKP
jgi:CheY-like chemotaxis protein